MVDIILRFLKSEAFRKILLIVVIVVLGAVSILLPVVAVVNEPIILIIVIIIIGASVEHSTKQKRKADIAQQTQWNEACSIYEEILLILYMLLKEFSYLGLHLPTEDSIRCTRNPIKWINGIPVFYYQVTLKETFQTDLEVFRQMLNQRIFQTLDYQPIYILGIKKLGNTLIIAVVYNNCPATNALIAEYERRKQASANVSADMRDEDF